MAICTTPYVLIYSMAGSLYFRICWGAEPNFVYSVGGFNPNFNTAGLDLPALQRCTVSIGDGDNPRISANNYFAVTSNSLQFGANVQAYASAAGFTIKGYLGFDVLIIFSPFSFDIRFLGQLLDFLRRLQLAVFDCQRVVLRATAVEPERFGLHQRPLAGRVSASLNITWGDTTPVTIPQKPVLPDLVTAIQATGNWSAALPPGMTPSVSLTRARARQPLPAGVPDGHAHRAGERRAAGHDDHTLRQRNPVGRQHFRD